MCVSAYVSFGKVSYLVGGLEAIIPTVFIEEAESFYSRDSEVMSHLSVFLFFL